jgi:Gpi18-like mannosyltransferase
MNSEPNRTNELLKEQWSIFSRDIFNRFKGKDWSVIGFNIAVFIFLAALGILIRLLLAYHYRIEYYDIIDATVWNRVVDFDPIGANFAGYSDFTYYYVDWIQGWFEDGWYPYTDWALAINGDNMYKYSYPPIFLYFLVLLWRSGMTHLWMAFPMILADVCCAGMVFLIVKEIFKKNNSSTIAFFAGLIMCLSPINIIYNGVYWLNPGPVTLFTLVSFYFLLKKKWRQTFFWLALATMTKQNALFFSYPVFMIMLGDRIKNEGIKRGSLNSVMNALYYIIICLLCSIPWIFISPANYGAHLLFPGQMLKLNFDIKDPIVNNTIQFSWSVNQLGISGFFLNFIAFGINSMLFMIIGANLIAIPLFWRSFKGKLGKIELFEWLSMYTIITHIFMPRGIYKFYSAYYMPIILIALLCSLFSFSKNQYIKIIMLALSLGMFFGFSIWHLNINRVFTPVLLFLACLVIGAIALARLGTEKLVRHYNSSRNKIIIT